MSKLKSFFKQLFCMHKDCILTLDKENHGVSCNKIICCKCNKGFRFNYSEACNNDYIIHLEKNYE